MTAALQTPRWRGQGVFLCLVSRSKPVLYTSVSQPPVRGPVPGPGVNYTGPREA